MSPNNANTQLNNLLISKDFDPQSLNAQGKPAASTEDAVMFSFDYIAPSGNDYGTVVMMIDEDHNLNVYFGDNLGKGMEQEDKKGWFDFLYQIRQFAKRNMMTFSIQNLNKLKYSMQGQAAIKEGLFESWSGKKDVSWNAAPTEARLMIKHKRAIGEGEARFRYVESLFIETVDGERYRMPFKSLSAGRAMLEHVRQGGKPYDIRGQHIATIVNEMSLLSRFKRANQGKIFEGETAQLVQEATQYYETLQKNLKALATKTGYTKYFESWSPADITDEDVIIEDLRHLFVEQNIDSRVEQALPLLAKLKQETAMKEANIFENYINLLAEGTWAVPDTKEKQQALVALLSQELPVGADATNATEQLYDLLGDDELFDRLEELADQDANADARQIILTRLEQLKSNPDVAQVIGQLNAAVQPKEEPVKEEMNSYDIDNKPCPKCHEKELTYLQGTNHVKCGACGKSFSLAGKPLRESAGDVMFKDQDRLDRLESLRSFAKAVGNTAKAEELDRQIKAIYTANPVGSRDDGHLEESELTIGDTIECPNGIIGEIIADEGDRWVVRDLHSEFEDDELEFRKSDCMPALSETVKDPRTQTEDPPNTKQPEVKPNSLSEEEMCNECGCASCECDSKTNDSSYRNSAHLDPINAMGQIKEGTEEYPAEGAIINRIMMAHPDVLAKFGPEAVMTAARDQAEWVGDVDEIGSSDVSGWVRNVIRDLESNDADAVYKLQHGKEEMDEASDTVKLDPKTGKPIAWRHEGDWEKSKNKDPRGQVTHMSDVERRKAEKLKESGMSEVDILLQEIARGTVDIMDVYANPKSNIEKFVREQIAEKIPHVAKENGLDPKKDIEDVLQRIQRELEVEYGVDDNMDIELETVGGGNWLEETDAAGALSYEDMNEGTALTGQYGHSGKLQAVKGLDQDMMDRIKFLAGITK